MPNHTHKPDPFKGRVRVRANGIIVRDKHVALVYIQSPTVSNPFWMPPGGGVLPGEILRDAVQREVKEETGLTVTAKELLLISEYINEPWHAVEFYFLCSDIEGDLITGSDPELGRDAQYIKDVQWISQSSLSDLNHKPSALIEILDHLSNQSDCFPLYRTEI